MRTLYIGDVHITEKDIPEIACIFDDILKIQADRVVQLGDFYNNNRPTPKELDFGTMLVANLKANYKEVVFISGNGQHDILHGKSAIEYLQYMGIKVIVGDYIDEDDILCGHFMLHESKLEYGSGKCGMKDLAKYKMVFLGHQHTPQTLQTGRIYHVGSIRYQHWNEVNDPFKRVTLVEDGKIKFIKLKSPIKMIDIKPGEAGVSYLREKLSKTPAKTKVRVILSSFGQLKNCIDYLKKQKNNFHEFTIKLNFEKNYPVETTTTQKGVKLEEILHKGIEKIQDEDVKKLLMNEFKRVNND